MLPVVFMLILPLFAWLRTGFQFRETELFIHFNPGRKEFSFVILPRKIHFLCSRGLKMLTEVKVGVLW